MHLSTRFARITVAPRQRPGGPSTLFITITLNTMLEISLTSRNTRISQPQVSNLLTAALNRHAGGARTLRQQPCQITWQLNWPSDPAALTSGRAIGISLIPDAMLNGSGKDGMWFASVGSRGELPRDGDTYNRILILGDQASQILTGRPGVPSAARTRFRNSAAHEIGHALGITHAGGTLMDDTNTNRMDRMMSDAQLIEVIEVLLPTGLSRPGP